MSKRMSSKLRHKKDRKVRESRRDMRKAAKSMKKAGLKPRSNRKRDATRQALALSNANPDKVRILEALLNARHAPKKTKAELAAAAAAAEAAEAELPSAVQHRRFGVFAGGSAEGGALTQLDVVLSSLHTVSDVFLFTLDGRCPAQCIPRAAVQRIIDESKERQSAGRLLIPRRIVFVITRCDILPLASAVSAVVHVARTIKEEFGASLAAAAKPAPTPSKGKGTKRGRDEAPASSPSPLGDAPCVQFHCALSTTTNDDVLGMVARLLRRVADQVRPVVKQLREQGIATLERGAAQAAPDVKNKVVITTIGFAKSGRSALCKGVGRVGGEASAATVRPADVHMSTLR